MKSYVKLSIASILICFTGCVTTNKSVNVADSNELATHKYVSSEKINNLKVKPNKQKSIKKKNRVKKPKISSNKPQEIERVCFDKEGKTHNCNYKIPKPYKQSSTIELYNQQ